jgi:c-di-GMP-related signal transduction protein
VLAHENANWEECRRIAEGLKLPEAELGELYLESIQWAGTVMRS